MSYRIWPAFFLSILVSTQSHESHAWCIRELSDRCGSHYFHEGNQIRTIILPSLTAKSNTLPVEISAKIREKKKWADDLKYQERQIALLENLIQQNQSYSGFLSRNLLPSIRSSSHSFTRMSTRLQEHLPATRTSSSAIGGDRVVSFP